MSQEALARAIDFNPRTAAKTAGAGNIDRLASALALERHRRLTALLQERGDSYMGQALDSFCALARHLGFQEIEKQERWNNGSSRLLAMEYAGWVLGVESYQGMVAQAILLLRQAEPQAGLTRTPGGSFRGAVGVREGLRYRIGQYRGMRLAISWEEDSRLLPGEWSFTPNRWPERLRQKLKAGN